MTFPKANAVYSKTTKNNSLIELPPLKFYVNPTEEDHLDGVTLRLVPVDVANAVAVGAADIGADYFVGAVVRCCEDVVDGEVCAAVNVAAVCAVVAAAVDVDAPANLLL
mmetsp:Transcript_8297/g.12721  ORF Transcript_8297/g.12721 Transcript_8297/m.12721 type:complete len:109 (-) Transcript_8297:404-730(-)